MAFGRFRIPRPPHVNHCMRIDSQKWKLSRKDDIYRSRAQRCDETSEKGYSGQADRLAWYPPPPSWRLRFQKLNNIEIWATFFAVQVVLSGFLRQKMSARSSFSCWKGIVTPFRWFVPYVTSARWTGCSPTSFEMLKGWFRNIFWEPRQRSRYVRVFYKLAGHQHVPGDRN